MAKGGTAIVIGLGRPKGAPAGKHADDEEDTGDSASAEDEAFQAAADAAKSGDGKAFKDALKTAMELCYPDLAGGYSEGDSEEEG